MSGVKRPRDDTPTLPSNTIPQATTLNDSLDTIKDTLTNFNARDRLDMATLAEATKNALKAARSLCTLLDCFYRDVKSSCRELHDHHFVLFDDYLAPGDHRTTYDFSCVICGLESSTSGHVPDYVHTPPDYIPRSQTYLYYPTHDSLTR